LLEDLRRKTALPQRDGERQATDASSMTAIRSLSLFMLAIIHYSFSRRFAGHLGQRIGPLLLKCLDPTWTMLLLSGDNRTLPSIG
jgi:hypothetical protein